MSSRFTVTEEHLKLLDHMWISWNDCEFGAPCVDCKRPYGNSDVIGDMIDILEDNIEACPHCGEPLGEIDEQKYIKLHNDMQTVLQILVSNRSIEIGSYFCNHQSTSWEKDENESS